MGHVLSSVILGFIGILFGIELMKLELFESVRGDVAAWLLIIFGITYCIWGIHRALRNKSHMHLHIHSSELCHTHEHSHKSEHSHIHGSKSITPWVIFTIFVFGPCEPLIPLIMYPASQGSIYLVILVALTFTVATVSRMLVAVTALSYGVTRIRFSKLELWSPALAGATIFASGAAIVFLGL